MLTPVTFPPGLARFDTMPPATGSLTEVTMGIVLVASLSRATSPAEKIMSGFWATASCAIAANRSSSPSAVYLLTTKFCPSMYPRRRSFLEERSNKRIADRFRDLGNWDCWEDDRNAIRFAQLLADGKLHRPEKQQASEEPSLHHMWHGPVPPHSVNLCKLGRLRRKR